MIKPIFLISMFGLLTSCAGKCDRGLKSIKSGVSGGLDRTCQLIHPFTGEVLKTYKGKIDLEYGSNGRVVFEFNRDKRIISKGILLICEEN